MNLVFTGVMNIATFAPNLKQASLKASHPLELFFVHVMHDCNFSRVLLILNT